MRYIVISWILEFLFTCTQLVIWGDNPRTHPYGMQMYYFSLIWMVVNVVSVFAYIGRQTPPEMWWIE